jgi:purine-binding chemotaxis protein CheW
MGSGIAQTAQWVVFRLDDGRYALPLSAVERIVRAAQVTPLPLAPPAVLGALDVAGEILPVFDLRLRFGLPQRPLDPADQFIIAHTTKRKVVLAVDSAQGVIEHAVTSVVDSRQLTPQLAHIRGVMALEDGLVLIQNLEELLSQDETLALDRALRAQEGSHVR